MWRWDVVFCAAVDGARQFFFFFPLVAGAVVESGRTYSLDRRALNRVGMVTALVKKCSVSLSVVCGMSRLMSLFLSHCSASRPLSFSPPMLLASPLTGHSAFSEHGGSSIPPHAAHAAHGHGPNHAVQRARQRIARPNVFAAPPHPVMSTVGYRSPCSIARAERARWPQRTSAVSPANK